MADDDTDDTLDTDDAIDDVTEDELLNGPAGCEAIELFELE